MKTAIKDIKSRKILHVVCIAGASKGFACIKIAFPVQ